VLRLTALGATYKEIALQLGVTPKTARNHLTNLYGQMGVHSRAEATMRAVRLGLVDPARDIAAPSAAERGHDRHAGEIVVEANASSTSPQRTPTIVVGGMAGPAPVGGGVNGRPS
jgi:predicted transcriptional regulator